MDFRVLGPFEVIADGRIVALGSGKQRALLALLVLHVNETLTAERLIDELWGERPPATATKALQIHVSRLRKALGAGLIVTRPRGYALVLDPDRIDARRFERLVAEGAFDDALALWRGPPLADLAHEPFARTHIDRLEELRLAALERRTEALLARGRHGEVIAELEALVAEQPYRERLRAQLMVALTARTARPTRSKRSTARARGSTRTSGSSRASGCARSSGRSLSRRRSSPRRAWTCCRPGCGSMARSSRAARSWRACASCGCGAAASSSPARPASARRGSRPSSRSRCTARSCSTAAATTSSPCPTSHSWRRSAKRRSGRSGGRCSRP